MKNRQFKVKPVSSPTDLGQRPNTPHPLRTRPQGYEGLSPLALGVGKRERCGMCGAQENLKPEVASTAKQYGATPRKCQVELDVVKPSRKTTEESASERKLGA